MKKALVFAVALALVWLYQGQVNVASAHGGTYRGPAGEVPPGQRQPKDPQPPPGTGGPPTTGGGGGGTSTGGGGPPTTGGGGSTNPPTGAGNPAGPIGNGGGLGGATTRGGKRKAPAQMSFDNWLFWWAFNKDNILNLKARLKAAERKVSSNSSSSLFRGTEGGKKAESPTVEKIRKDVVPALKKILANPKVNPDIRGGALIALARATDSPDVLKIFFDYAKPGAHVDKLVRESAVVALGILDKDSPEVQNFLVKIVNDEKYPWRARCFAMISMGLLKANSPKVLQSLIDRLNPKESPPDLHVCALLSLGLIGDSNLTPKIMSWIEKGRAGQLKFHDTERAWAVSALGKIGDPQALDLVLKTLRLRGLFTQRSAMIAVGDILPQADPKVQTKDLRRFVGYIRNEKDTMAKNFGIISLGRIAASKGIDPDMRRTIVTYLLNDFKHSNRSTERPYDSLAIGLVGFPTESNPKPRELRYELAKPLFADLSKLRGDKVALGAEAIALGMLDDSNKDCVKLLVDILKDRGQDRKLRGSAAMALGLLGGGGSEGKAAIISALKEREDRDLRVDTAIAAGLIGDPDAVKVLVDILNDPKAGQFVLGSVALALGQIGDAKAIDPLLNILQADKTTGTYPDMTRALVAVALGQLSDRSDIRMLARVSKDINYRALVPALREFLTIL